MDFDRGLLAAARRSRARGLAFAVLLFGCGTTSEATRLRLAVTTFPSDSAVVVRHGDQVLASGPAPLHVDETRDVTVYRRGGWWVALVAGGLGLVVGGVMVATSGDGSDGNPAIGQALSPLAFGPGLALGLAGLIGLVLTQDPPFTVSATRDQIRFPIIAFEPGEAQREIFLEAPHPKRSRSDAAGARREAGPRAP